jgi:two-component SAPR family response regulator
VVERDGDRYFVASRAGLEYDVAEFTAELERAHRSDDTDETISHLRRAIDLARGEYLEGVDADWARDRADALRALTVKSLLDFGRRQIEAGAPAEAAEAFARAAELEPLDEEAHRGLMLAHAKAGERVKALQQYDRLAAALQRELGVEPDATTKALRQAIKQREPIQAA